MHFCSLFTLPKNGFDINYIKLWTFLWKFWMLSIRNNYVASLFLFVLGSIVEWAAKFLNPVECKAWFTFCDSLLLQFIYIHSAFCSVSHRRSVNLHLCHDQRHWWHLKVLYVACFLMPLSLLKNFLSQKILLSLSLTLVQNFSISANKQFEFLKQSDLFWKLFSMCWKYSLLPF